MNLEKDIEQANRGFYRALESLDLSQMESVWLSTDWVKCIHPGRETIVGWPRIRESWELIFEHTQAMKVALRQTWVKVMEGVGWVVCTENISAYLEEGLQSAVAQATNLFMHHDGQWRMVHHHASPIPLEAPFEAGQTVQ